MVEQPKLFVRYVQLKDGDDMPEDLLYSTQVLQTHHIRDEDGRGAHLGIWYTSPAPEEEDS